MAYSEFTPADPPPSSLTLLDLIDSALSSPRPDRRGERWALCPFHGDRRIGSFSYSERGYSCFACGEHGSLRDLARRLTLSANVPTPAWTPRPTTAPEPRPWQRQASPDRQFLPPSPLAVAYLRGRGFSDATIARWQLGSGILPSSACRCERVCFAVRDRGQVVALRGRRLATGCQHPKWLSAGGSTVSLWGAELLEAGRTVVIAEAPFSAMLAMQAEAEIVSVAPSMGAGTWRPEWTRRIAESDPAWVLVWYDHDNAGQKNSSKVAEALRTAGVRVRVYAWQDSAAESCDLADVVTFVGRLPVQPAEPWLRGIPRDLW